MELLMFAGAGSVGKTTLMETCKDMAIELGLKVDMHHSSTRQSYANAGLTAESDALKDPEFNRRFQHTVMADNIEALHSVAMRAARAMDRQDLVIADRSPYDYSGYYFTVFRDHLDLSLIAEKRKQCDESLMRLMQYANKIHVIMLPYPTSWAVDTESSDGWRADKTGKNFVWSSVIEAELADAKLRFATRDTNVRDRVTFGRLPSFMERGSPEARAVGALAQVFPHLR